MWCLGLLRLRGREQVGMAYWLRAGLQDTLDRFDCTLLVYGPQYNHVLLESNNIFVRIIRSIRLRARCMSVAAAAACTAALALQLCQTVLQTLLFCDGRSWKL